MSQQVQLVRVKKGVLEWTISLALIALIIFIGFALNGKLDGFITSFDKSNKSVVTAVETQGGNAVSAIQTMETNLGQKIDDGLEAIKTEVTQSGDRTVLAVNRGTTATKRVETAVKTVSECMSCSTKAFMPLAGAAPAARHNHTNACGHNRVPLNCASGSVEAIDQTTGRAYCLAQRTATYSNSSSYGAPAPLPSASYNNVPASQPVASTRDARFARAQALSGQRGQFTDFNPAGDMARTHVDGQYGLGEAGIEGGLQYAGLREVGKGIAKSGSTTTNSQVVNNNGQPVTPTDPTVPGGPVNPGIIPNPQVPVPVDPTVPGGPVNPAIPLNPADIPRPTHDPVWTPPTDPRPSVPGGRPRDPGAPI